jgi:hypothetical protein
MVKVKGQVYPTAWHEDPQWQHGYYSNLYLTPKLDGGCTPPRPSRFTIRKETRYTPYRKVPGPTWAGKENTALTGTQHPDSPTRGDALYHTDDIPAHHFTMVSHVE